MAARHDTHGATARRTGRMLGAIVALLFVSTTSLHAQIVRTFASRYSTNANGTVQIVGNALLTCPTSNAACAAGQNGTGTIDNNNFSMVDIDIDGDASTQNSSSATFSLPPGGSVLFAGLYWGARSNAAARNTVRFRTPALAGYATVTATQVDANNPAYQGFANVTALVQAGGSGSYTVANVQRTLGTDQYAGWALVVVVQDPLELRRNLVVFDGYGTVQSSATTVTIPVSGFLTPSNGPVNAQLGVVGYEGDLGQTGDVLRLNATGLSDATNPANNIFNSSISRLGTRLTAKNPNYVNQIGFDADVISAAGILPNGSTSATITLTTGGETYYPGVVTLATQLYVPDLTTTFTKTVTDVNGGAVQRGDTLEYVVSFTNTGQDTALAVVVTDTIPVGTTFVPGSISYISSVTSGPPTGPKTDLPGDDAANYEPGANRLLARLGIGATAAAGGRLGPGQGSSFRFRVVVNPALPTASLVTNQAGIDYSGQTLGDLFNGRSDGDAGTPGIQPTVVTLAADADVQTGKTGPATGSVGLPLTYTLTVSNAGPDAAAAVVLRDTLPAGFTFVSATGGGTISGNVVTWPAIASLANGASQGYTVTATPTATGSFTNIAASTAGTFDGIAANNNGSAAVSRVTTVVAGGVADVRTSKSGPATINAGQNVTYTVSVTNDGPTAATAVVLTDTLPSGSTFVSATGGGIRVGSVVTWPTIASLANGATQTFTVVVTAPVTGTLLNLAASSSTTPDPDLSNNNGSAAASRVVTVVVEQANIAVTKTGPATIAAGANLSYSVTVTNAGPSAAANVVITDTLPAAAAFVSATGGGTATGNVVTWPAIASLANGGTQSFTVTVTAPGSGPLLNIAAGTSTTADPVPANNNGSAAPARVTTAVTAAADVQMTKTGPASVSANQAITYTITVTNAGPSAAAAVIVRDSLPAAGTFVSAVPAGTRVGRLITWPTIASLAPGASQVFTVTWTAPANPAVPLTLRNMAYSTGTTPDPVPANNSNTNPAAIVNTVVNAAADIATTKTGPATVNALTNYTYTLTTRNNGPSPATAVVISDTLPAAVTFVSASNAGVLGAGNVVTWPAIATLASATTATRTVTVRSPASGTVLNIAASRSATADPNPGDNNGSAPAARVTTVVNTADVATIKTGPATVNGGANYTYTLTVRNNGTGVATGIVVTDTLPATVTFVSATNGGVLGAGNVVTWPVIATLANAASTTRRVTVTAPASGTLLNIAASTSTSADPVPGNNDGSAAGARVTTVVNTADVVTTKTGPATANAGANITYTLTVRNAGPGAATGIVLRDTLPATVTFVSASAGGTLGAGNVVTWPAIATLANAATTTRTVTVTTPASGTLLNIAASTSTSVDPNPANNNGTAAGARVTTVIQVADVATTKTGPATASGGANYSYTITVRNNGPNAAPGIVVTDTLPPTVAFVSASNGGTLGAGNVVTWPTIATLANGATTTRTVTVTAPATGSLLNIVASRSATTDPVPDNNNGSLPAARVTTVVSAADLVTTKTGPATVNPGASITYTITTRNQGPNAAPGVVVRDTLPATVTFVSASNAGVLGAGNVVTWPAVASLANGASFVRTVTVTAPAIGTLLNISASSSATTDPNPANSNGSLPAARVTTLVNPTDVVTTKTGPGTATVGSNISYAITVRNAGPVNAVGVIVTDTLPAGLTFVSATGGGTSSGNVVTWPTIPNLANGASQAFSVTVAVPLGGTFTNIVASTAASGDLNPGNNNGSLPAARVTTVVLDQADVATTKSGPATVNAGQVVTYTIATVNNGPTAAQNVVVTDTLPAAATFVSASAGGTVSGNVVTWPAVGSLANGATLSYTVTVTAPLAGVLLDIAASSAATPDPVPANNNGSLPAARVTTTVVEQADVATSKTGPATVDAGQNFSYAISVVNGGPSAAAGIVVSDTLPAGVTFVSASAGGSVAGNVVTWPAIPTLASGASQGYSVTVTAPASGTLLNLAASTAITADPDPANNNGSSPASRVTTTVVEQADVIATKTGPATVNAGQAFSYAVSVANAGPSAAAAVAVSDTLPAGATFVSATGGGTLAGNVVTWPVIASLASGASQGYGVTVTAPASGSLTNIVASTSPTTDPDPANNNGSEPAGRVITTIVEVADVVTTKTGPATAIATTDFSYAISVRNDGPSSAAGVVVTDTLPIGVTFVSASGGGTVSGNVISWPAIAALPNGASQGYVVTVTAPATGTLLNIVASTSSTGDSDPANNNGSAPSARVTTVVEERADIATSKTGPSTVPAAGQFGYTITTRNLGPSAASSVVVSDTLPAAVTFVSATGGGVLSGNVVTWPAIGTMASGAVQSFDITVTAPATGSFTNVVASTAGTIDPVPGNNDGSDPASRVTTTVSELADVATGKSGPARVNAGDVVNYTITVTNLGPSAATDVLVSDPLPAGAVFVAASNGGAVSGSAVQWPAISSLAAGQTLTYTLQLRAPLIGALTNVVSSTATTTDPVPANNNGSMPAAQVLTTIEPVDLAVTKASLPEFRIGTVGSYTLTVRNVGNAPSVGAITVVDTLPASLRYSSAEGAGWGCSAAGSIVTCVAAGPLAAGAASAILLNVDVLPAAAPSVTNSVAVATPGDTASGGNNASSVATAVRAQSPLVAQKSSGSTTAEIGDVVDYTLVVENQSSQPVPAVVFNDQLPLGFAYQPGTARLNGIVVPDPAGAPGPALGFPVGTVSGNGTATVTYRVYVGPGAAAGDGLNRAQALSTISGVASNMATAKVEVTGGVFSDRGIIAGKIFIDCSCDPDRVQGPRDVGIPGVRIMLEDGTSTVTDVEGKFNFYGLAPRVHVLKVDVTTLPPGSRLAAVSSRNAGDGWTRFVDLRNSEFARGDFVEVSSDPSVLAAVIARRNRGEITAAIPDSTPMILTGDSLAPSGETVPAAAYQPLLGGLSSPVTAEGAASPVLRLPQSEQPERLPRPTDARLEMMVPAQGIPADGQTSVPVRLKVVASDGSAIATPATVTLETTLGRWLVEDLDATEPGVQAQLRDGQGDFMLAAAPREGVGEIRATTGALVQTGRVAFLPVERPLTAVGIVEGRIDLRSLAKGSLVPATPQDGFEQELKDISISSDSGLNRAAARAALYLQGKVKGSYLLTLAFDTERDPGKRYMQDIQPDEFYPVYGDASVKDYGAQSYDRLYVRIDKDRNYFLYGDYQTPSPSQARQLGGYLRSLTGAVQHFENKTVQANAFASRTRITQVVDELRGMGISGPYQLSQANARINSERIDILTRDRNQPERVLKITSLQRFTDYTVEAFTGRILLRQPLPSLDAQLNPVSMRVTYEVEPQDAPQSWVYGADAQVRLSSFAEVGGAVIQDDNPFNGRQIYTLNGSARLGSNTQLVTEGALTSTDSLGEGGAGRFELRHQSGRFSGNIFGAMSATTFSNPSATFGAGQLQAGARAAMQLDTKSTVRAEALLSEDRVNGGRRKGALVAYERSISRLFRAELGYRWAEETTTPVDTATAITPGATPNETNAIGLKVTGILPSRRGSASVEFEQDVVNTDQRRAALAAEYWVFPRLRLYGRYELLSSFAGPYALNGAQRLAQAVVGFDLAYFRDGQFFSEYRARDAFSGREAEATIGLRNRWQLAPGVRLDASFERVNPIKGGAGTEATAVTAAVEYTRSPLWKGTLRAEYRNATGGDNFLATLGYARKLTRDWTLLGRGFWNSLPEQQLRTRGQLGLAWRQTDQNRWNGLARVEHGVERLRTGASAGLTSRQLDIAVAQLNYQPILRLTLSAQYAAKWLRQEDAFLSRTATQLGQVRGIYDLDRNWDVGLQGSMMWGGSFDSRRYGVGGELGRRVINNLRVAAGYNLFGFRDSDLRETDYTLQGAYLRLDFKFDESILPGLKKTEEAP